MKTHTIRLLAFFFLLLPLYNSAQIPDTVYSKTVTSFVIIDGQLMDSASIQYTLFDSINDNQQLIRSAISDSLGQDVADSLPVVKHPVGIFSNAFPFASGDIFVSNNGTGSDHLIRFTSDAEKIGKEGYIINILGQQLATIPINYNPLTKTYDAVWHGQNIKNGTYLFHTTSTKGPIASKITHLANKPSVIEYGAVPKENDDGKKDTKAIKEDEGASHYIINITHEGLEDFIDTVLVKENNFHDFTFNVNGIQYDSSDVWGQIFFVEGGQSPSDADVEYKRLLDPSSIFNTTAPNGVYNIQVPVVFEQANPGLTKYIVTISENGGDPFITKIDTVLVTPGVFGVTHYVSEEGSNPTQDIEGIVRHVYTKALESGVTVRVINRTTGELIEEDITGSDGKYHFADILAGTEVEFELGKTGELWMVNNEYDVPENISDTLIAFHRYFYPKNVEVPEVGANSIIIGDGEEAAEMVGPDYINFEEILRDLDYMWANGPGTAYWSARTWIQDNFYEGNSPITTANTQRNITATMQENYEPYTNYYAGQLGWNVNFGQGNSTSPLYATTDHGVIAVIGGEIMITDDGTLAPIIKELQGRRLQLGSVSSRPSMMNANPAMPDNKDRAYVHLILINQDGRFDTDQETYSLENLTSVEPDGKWGNKVDNGNKPHSRMHFNKEKYREQLKAQEEK